MADNDTQTAAQHAGTAAEAIRSLNHATFPVGRSPSAPEYPSDVCDAVANLKALGQRLPQAFEQLAGILTQLGHDGHLRVHPGQGDLSTAQDETYAALHDAISAAHAMAAALDRAHNALALIGYQD